MAPDISPLMHWPVLLGRQLDIWLALGGAFSLIRAGASDVSTLACLGAGP